MNNQIHPNNPAYIDGGLGGMTIRAEIAQRAMTAMLSTYTISSTWPDPEATAARAVSYADALIDRLSRPTPQQGERP